jgi:hypothetical protein
LKASRLALTRTLFQIGSRSKNEQILSGGRSEQLITINQHKRELVAMSDDNSFVYSAIVLAVAAVFLHFMDDFFDKAMPDEPIVLPMLRTSLKIKIPGRRILSAINYSLIIISIILFIFGVLWFGLHLTYNEFISIDLLMSVLLFIVLSEFLKAGLGQVLTKWRGENWTKELDYIYLIIGTVGVLISINKVSLVMSHTNIPDALGPIAFSVASVLRAIKTRAEINNWNKH